KILNLPELLMNPQYADNSQRVQNRAKLDQLIQAIFSQYATDELVGNLKDARIAFGMLNDVAHLSGHGQLRRKMAPTEGGDIELVASPVRFDGEDVAFGQVPALGQHNSMIRDEFSKE
ncbi:MAG: CoA transferase, partial [Emcibacter sp.]|nr:CoA transferase [Emcibacter sp.]